MQIDMIEFDMAQVNKEAELSLAFVKAFDILGKKWNGVIIHLLAQSDCRFSQIAKCVPEMSDRMLSVRLNELEQLAIITKSTHNFGKAKLMYSLTPKGLELAKALQDIERWSKKWHMSQEDKKRY